MPPKNGRTLSKAVLPKMRNFLRVPHEHLLPQGAVAMQGDCTAKAAACRSEKGGIEMNITIKFTSPEGASMEVLIPIPLNAQNLAVSTPTAAQTKPKHEAASEPAFPATGGLVDRSAGIRYGSVGTLIANCDELERANATEKKEEGEVGGEEGGCKGEEGEKEGKRKEKPDPEMLELQREAELNVLNESRDLCEIQFRTQQGMYLPDPSFVHDLVKVYGDEFVRKELLKSKIWLDAHPHKAKTMKGMRSYISKWMNRAAETLAFVQFKAPQQQPPPPKPSGSLLDARKSQEAMW
jgi:hypothetical protein